MQESQERGDNPAGIDFGRPIGSTDRPAQATIFEESNSIGAYAEARYRALFESAGDAIREAFRAGTSSCYLWLVFVLTPLFLWAVMSERHVTRL